MDTYQQHLIEIFEPWRPTPTYPTYPPYHEGLYMEDYFFDRFIKDNIEIDRYYIPVFWTTCYIENYCNGLQHRLDDLDPSKKYFIVAQHDDAVKERLPKDTIEFTFNGNRGGFLLPPICSPIRDDIKVKKQRDIFCSFVGCNTHPIRNLMCNILMHNPKYYISSKNWSPRVSENSLRSFIDITSRSIFCLCPRGYGRSSFRLHEAMQLGSIPVYIYDHKWFPFDDEIDWNEFCVLVDFNNIQNIDAILSSYSSDRIKKMQDNLHPYWENNFTRESVFKKIIDKIK